MNTSDVRECAGCKSVFTRPGGGGQLYTADWIDRHYSTCAPYQALQKSRRAEVAAARANRRKRARLGDSTQISDVSAAASLLGLPLSEDGPHISIASGSDSVFESSVSDKVIGESPMDIDPPIAEPPGPRRSGRARRRVFWLPPEDEPLPSGPSVPSPEPIPPPSDTSAPSASQQPKPFRTPPNSFGVYRIYPHSPTCIPDLDLPLESYLSEEMVAGRSDGSKPKQPAEIVKPLPHPTAYLFLKWQVDGITKTLSNIEKLMAIQRHPLYNNDDWNSLATHGTITRLTKLLEKPSNSYSEAASWQSSPVSIEIPIPKPRGVPPPSERTKIFTIPGLQHRKLVPVLRAILEGPQKAPFHFTPFQQRWKSPIPGDPDHEESMIDEAYNSEAWLEEHARLQLKKELGEDGKECTLEKAIIGLMFWSDATQIANFGSDKLWPLYLQLGNISHRHRAKLFAGACHHVAYLVSISDEINDFIRKHTSDGSSAKSTLLTHLRRELMHAIWDLLLDDEFLQAYEHGIVITCSDGVKRRMYPRIFTYSADYPEKVLLATIRDNGGCPCVWCLVRKEDIHLMGTKRDMAKREKLARKDSPDRQALVRRARELIMTKSLGVNSSRVEDLLKKHSYVPTENAFSKKLLPLGHDCFRMLVPDIMHEFDLGRWKDTFKFLVRLLNAVNSNSVGTLNERYRQVPSFGAGKIRKIRSNAAETKNMAARDYEDLLQCSIPVFEGLLPDHDPLIADLLFILNTWQYLAKLRMHTASTLSLLQDATTELGRITRKLDADTALIPTFETASEVAARRRREEKLGKSSAGSSAARPKRQNLDTPKGHMAGHIWLAIMLFGPTISYSTSRGELEHKLVKALYRLTNKNGFEGQIAKAMQVRGELLRMEGEIQAQARGKPAVPSVAAFAKEPYWMAAEQSGPAVREIDQLQATEDTDPATLDFTSRLRNHLLDRINGGSIEKDEVQYSELDRSTVRFASDRIYSHQTMRIYYTAYDITRAHDVISLGAKGQHCDVMVRAYEDEGDGVRFWYARVLGIYHANVYLPTPEGAQYPKGKRFDFLYVRWFGRDSTFPAGWKARRLDRVGFLPFGDPNAFGFLDPRHVIRAAHLIPSFLSGRTEEMLGRSKYRDAEGDWAHFYVNRFVDGDMALRFTDLGPGHRASRDSKLEDNGLLPQPELDLPEDLEGLEDDGGDEEDDAVTEEPDGDESAYGDGGEGGEFDSETEDEGEGDEEDLEHIIALGHGHRGAHSDDEDLE